MCATIAKKTWKVINVYFSLLMAKNKTIKYCSKVIRAVDLNAISS